MSQARTLAQTSTCTRARTHTHTTIISLDRILLQFITCKSWLKNDINMRIILRSLTRTVEIQFQFPTITFLIILKMIIPLGGQTGAHAKTPYYDNYKYSIYTKLVQVISI